MSTLGAPRGTGIARSLRILSRCGAVLLILAPLHLPIRFSEGAENGSSTRPSPPGPDRSSKSATPSPAAIARFQAHCITCHDGDGRGEIVRDLMRTIPDFTDPTWQASRNDQQLLHSIGEGKGKFMPAMKGKLAPADIEPMIVLVRRFSGGQLVVPEEGTVAPGSPPNPPDDVPPAARVATPAVELERGRRGTGRGRDLPALLPDLPRRRWSGASSGSRLPGLPDFTSGLWQEGRSRAQLAASILEGKGGMPSFRGKLSTAEVRALASYVRAFGPIPEEPQNTLSDDFDRRFDLLQREFEELRHAYRELSPQLPIGELGTSGLRTR